MEFDNDFIDGAESPTNAAIYVKKFWKNQTKPSHWLGRLKIYFTANLGYSNHFRGIYMDTDYGFILAKKRIIFIRKKPAALACIGFDLSRNEVIIRQIQGVRRKGRLLKRFKWERMLVNLVVDWAKTHGFGRVSIIKAEQSRWHWSRDKKAKRIMYMHYDVTAKRSGFKFNPNDNCYVKRFS